MVFPTMREKQRVHMIEVCLNSSGGPSFPGGGKSVAIRFRVVPSCAQLRIRFERRSEIRGLAI